MLIVLEMEHSCLSGKVRFENYSVVVTLSNWGIILICDKKHASFERSRSRIFDCRVGDSTN